MDKLDDLQFVDIPEEWNETDNPFYRKVLDDAIVRQDSEYPFRLLVPKEPVQAKDYFPCASWVDGNVCGYDIFLNLGPSPSIEYIWAYIDMEVKNAEDLPE